MEIFELYLSPIDKTRFKAIFIQSPVGEGETESELPFFEGNRDWRMTLVKTLESVRFQPDSFHQEGEREWMVQAKILTDDQEAFHPSAQVNIGRALYQALFPAGSRVEKALRSSMRWAEEKNTQLHIRLKFEADVVKRSRLADYPWELLHDGQRFLCHHVVNLSRYIAYDSVPPALPPVEQVNVLLISSAAFDSQLELKRLARQEQQAIRKGLEKASQARHIQLSELEYATFNGLRAYLTEEETPHVLHFDGHGLFGKRCPNSKCGAMHKSIKAEKCRVCQTGLREPQGYLVFEQEDGEPHYVSAKELGTLLQQTSMSDGNSPTGGVALVVLSACQSGMAVAGESVFNGTAQNLIEHRVPAVVAMQYAVSVEAASQFAEQFYRSLGQKNSLLIAVSHGREAMGAEGNQWFRPVLYLRWRDNQGAQLFALPSSADGIQPAIIPQNLPRSGVINFVGRATALETLHQQLQQTERIAICSVTGMGGVGKTELALQYAQAQWQQGTYPGGVCWLLAGDATIGTQIVTFARVHLDLQLPEDLDIETQVAYCWRHWLMGEVLVVIDNVRDYDQIKPYLPPAEPRFKVLLTTRRQWLGASFEVLRLQVLEEGAALELLELFIGQQRRQQEPEQAKQLCESLGFLPLGLELVGRYLQRKPDLSLVEIRRRLSLEHRSLQHSSKDMTARLGVLAAFELSWQELSELEKQLGCLLSLFALAPIPWILVEQCLPDTNAEALEDARDEALLNLSLLERPAQRIYQLHQLIREFFSSKLKDLAEPEKLKQGFCQAMVTAAKQIPQTLTQQKIAEVAPSIPHIAEAATAQKNWLEDEDLISTFWGLGRFYEGQGTYEKATQWLEQCLSDAEARLGKEHPHVAASLNNLAYLYKSQGRYDQAEPLYVQALALRRKLLGEEHPDVATSLNNLACVYDSQGRYELAEHLYVQALALIRKLLGEEHPDVATILNNLALLYNSQGRYDQAEPLFVQALELTIKLLGEEHPAVAISLNNLASVYFSQGRYDQAEPLFVQALELTIKLLGEEHPDVAISLNNLALLYNSQGRYDQAEPLYVQALALYRKRLGEEHPHVATSLNNLALLYNSQGRYEQAEPLLVQALALYRKRLGEEHPDVATSLNNLACVYKSQGRYEQAEPLYVQALALRRKLLGE